MENGKEGKLKIDFEQREKVAEEELKKLINENKEENILTSEYQIKRLINTNFSNPYDILQLTTDCSEEMIKKQYRKLSLLVHPDKNTDEKAADAFHGK